MISPHYDRRFQLPFFDHVIHCQSELRAFAVAEPANAGGQTLELDPLASEIDPATKNAIVGKQFEYEVVGRMNVGRFAGKRYPAERTSTFTEQRPNVCRHESRKVVCVLHA